MRILAALLLSIVSCVALAQANVRVRGTITALNGDVLAVKTREGRDINLTLHALAHELGRDNASNLEQAKS